MPDKSSQHRTSHKAHNTTPGKTNYTWHDYTRPSSDLAGQGQSYPPSRCKHAACHHDHHVYIHGGRNGGVSHRDLWRYGLSDASWEKLRCTGEQPMSPQEHTMVAYKNNLYVFGGQFSSCVKDVPLWILNLETLVWRKIPVHSEVVTPSGRRGHSAVVYEDMMCVYGGYVDLKGSSNEVWLLDLENEIWHLNTSGTIFESNPDGRHGHSAVMYDAAMFVYGGMTDLVAKDDFWRYDFICSQWNRIKCRPSPPPLKGHSASVVADQMLIYGGASQGSLLNTLWCFHFSTSTWCKLSSNGQSPFASVQHTALVVTATDSQITTKHDRSRSHPHLRANLDPPKDAYLDRPYSSPPNVTTAKEPSPRGSPAAFMNKIQPSEPLPEYNTLAQPNEQIKEICVKRSENGGSGNVDSERLVVSRSTWRSTGCVSVESTKGEGDDSFTELRRSHTADSISPSSAEYMDTVAGAQVNRIITKVNNMLVRGISAEFEAGGDVVNKQKRRRMPDYLDDPLAKRSTSLDDILKNQDLLKRATNRNNGHDSHGENSRRRSGCVSAHDMKLEDIEDDEITGSYLNGGRSRFIVNDSIGSSDDVLNISNSSETAQLVSSQHGNTGIGQSNMSRIQCFRKAPSYDSLPYGVINPLYHSSDESLSENLQNGDETSLRTIKVNGRRYQRRSEQRAQGTHPKPDQLFDSDLSIMQNTQVHCDTSAENRQQMNPQNEFTNPTYFNTCTSDTVEEMIELRDFTPKQESKKHEEVLFVALPRSNSPVMQAWGDAQKVDETSLSRATSKNIGNLEKKPAKSELHNMERSSVLQKSPVREELHGAVGGAAWGIVTPPLPLVHHLHNQFIMYVIGGQTNETRGFGYSPLQMWQLHVSLDKPGSTDSRCSLVHWTPGGPSVLFSPK